MQNQTTYQSHFDPSIARLLCQFSAEAYGVDSQVKIEPVILAAPQTDTLACVTVTKQSVIVAFRGTQDLRNWITDIDCAFSTEPSGIRLHAGFSAALDSILPEIKTLLCDRLAARKLWLTGHSLGGALAMLCAWRMRNWNINDIRVGNSIAVVYTFGQPRVGDRAFRDAYQFSGLGAKTWRVVHAADIVPRVPWLLGNYRHAGHEAFYPAPVGRDSVDPYLDLPAWGKLLLDTPELIREWTHPRLALLADHHIGKYSELFYEHSQALIQAILLKYKQGDLGDVAPLDGSAVEIGYLLPERFTLNEAIALVEQKRASFWIARWKELGWLKTVGPMTYQRTEEFGILKTNS